VKRRFDFRKLAAIDIVFLGYKLVFAEYTFGVLFSIKEQLMLFSDRTSTHYLRSNQLRLYFSSIAYVLLQMLRRLGLRGTELAKAQCSSIRLKVLKIGALIRITVRKVWVSLAGGYPYVTLFRQVYEKLCAMPLKC
jgi:hypothetical protein